MTELYPYMLPFAGLLLGSAAFIWMYTKSRDFDNEFQPQSRKENVKSDNYADLKSFIGELEISERSATGKNQDIIRDIAEIQEKIKRDKS